jgi:putative serine protease PepD
VQGEAGNIGVGFAIPVEQVKVTADQILRTGEARYPVIGAKVVTGGEGSAAGAEISEVLPDTPADQAGLEEGDVVTQLDGLRVTDGIALIVAIRSHRPGEDVDLLLTRGDEELTLSVTLGSEVG